MEVVSPPERRADVQVKVAEYFAAGARVVWVIEPASRTVHAHGGPGGARVLGADDTLTGGDLLPGFRCDVRRLFP